MSSPQDADSGQTSGRPRSDYNTPSVSTGLVQPQQTPSVEDSHAISGLVGNQSSQNRENYQQIQANISSIHSDSQTLIMGKLKGDNSVDSRDNSCVGTEESQDSGSGSTVTRSSSERRRRKDKSLMRKSSLNVSRQESKFVKFISL